MPGADASGTREHRASARGERRRMRPVHSTPIASACASIVPFRRRRKNAVQVSVNRRPGKAAPGAGHGGCSGPHTAGSAEACALPRCLATTGSPRPYPSRDACTLSHVTQASMPAVGRSQARGSRRSVSLSIRRPPRSVSPGVGWRMPGRERDVRIWRRVVNDIPAGSLPVRRDPVARKAQTAFSSCRRGKCHGRDSGKVPGKRHLGVRSPGQQRCVGTAEYDDFSTGAAARR